MQEEYNIPKEYDKPDEVQVKMLCAIANELNRIASKLESIETYEGAICTFNQNSK